MQITSKQGQWIGDIVVRESGSIDDLFAMAITNDCSITDNMKIGTILNPSVQLDKRTINYYERNDIHVATSSINNKLLGGIGYMGIEIDFIVS